MSLKKLLKPNCLRCITTFWQEDILVHSFWKLELQSFVWVKLFTIALCWLEIWWDTPMIMVSNHWVFLECWLIIIKYLTICRILFFSFGHCRTLCSMYLCNGSTLHDIQILQCHCKQVQETCKYWLYALHCFWPLYLDVHNYLWDNGLSLEYGIWQNKSNI